MWTVPQTPGLGIELNTDIIKKYGMQKDQPHDSNDFPNRKTEQDKKGQQADAFLIGSPSSVKYFSGYFFYFEYGSSPFHLLPAILMVVPEQGQRLFWPTMKRVSPIPLIRCSNIPYESYRFENPPDPSGEIIKKLIEFILKINSLLPGWDRAGCISVRNRAGTGGALSIGDMGQYKRSFRAAQINKGYR